MSAGHFVSQSVDENVISGHQTTNPFNIVAVDSLHEFEHDLNRFGTLHGKLRLPSHLEKSRQGHLLAPTCSGIILPASNP
jgi:hypothetical protein